MIRGMKKKLLIGLLTAAVVGSSLAPSVPYSVEFTQEVKADPVEAAAEVPAPFVVKSLSLTPKDYGWNGAGTGTGDVYELTGSNYTKKTEPTSSTSVGYTFTKVNEPVVADIGTYYEREEAESVTTYKKTTDSTITDGKSYYIKNAETVGTKISTYVIPAPSDATENPVKFYKASDCSGNEINVIDGGIKATDTNNGKVYYKAVDTSKAQLTIEDGDESSTAGGNIKVGAPTIEQTGEVSASGKIGTASIVKTGVDTVVKTILSNIPAGKKIKKVEGTYQKDGVAEKVEGTFDATTKEATFNLGKLTEDLTLTITATVEDVKIAPTLDTSMLKDATAAFDGETAVNQNGGRLTVLVTPKDAKYLDDLSKTVEVTTTDGEKFEYNGHVGGKLVYTRTGLLYASETPKVVVTGGLANSAKETIGKDYAEVNAAYNVSIDNKEVLAAYKSLSTTDADKNSSVTVSASTSSTTPASFTTAINADKAKNENLKDARLTVTVTVKGGQTQTASETADADDATKNVPEFDTPIEITVMLPVDAQGKGGYIVYRDHNGETQRLTETLVGGEGVKLSADGTKLSIYTKKLSDFSVFYDDSKSSSTTPEVNPTDPTDPTNPTDPTTPDAGNTDNGAVTPANPAAAAGATTATKADEAKKAPAAPAPAKKLSAKTGSPKTADYAVNSLLALLTGAAGLFGISLMNSKKRKDEDQ